MGVTFPGIGVTLGLAALLVVALIIVLGHCSGSVNFGFNVGVH